MPEKEEGDMEKGQGDNQLNPNNLNNKEVKEGTLKPSVSFKQFTHPSNTKTQIGKIDNGYKLDTSEEISPHPPHHNQDLEFNGNNSFLLSFNSSDLEFELGPRSLFQESFTSKYI